MTPEDIFKEIQALIKQLEPVLAKPESEVFREKAGKIKSFLAVLLSQATAGASESMYYLRHVFVALHNAQIAKECRKAILGDDFDADISFIQRAHDWLVKAYEAGHLKAHLYVATLLDRDPQFYKFHDSAVDSLSAFEKAQYVLLKLVGLMKALPRSDNKVLLKERIRTWFAERGKLMPREMARYVRSTSTAEMQHSLSYEALQDGKRAASAVAPEGGLPAIQSSTAAEGLPAIQPPTAAEELPAKQSPTETSALLGVYGQPQELSSVVHDEVEVEEKRSGCCNACM